MEGLQDGIQDAGDSKSGVLDNLFPVRNPFLRLRHLSSDADEGAGLFSEIPGKNQYWEPFILMPLEIVLFMASIYGFLLSFMNCNVMQALTTVQKLEERMIREPFLRSLFVL